MMTRLLLSNSVSIKFDCNVMSKSDGFHVEICFQGDVLPIETGLKRADMCGSVNSKETNLKYFLNFYHFNVVMSCREIFSIWQTENLIAYTARQNRIISNRLHEDPNCTKS